MGKAEFSGFDEFSVQWSACSQSRGSNAREHYCIVVVEARNVAAGTGGSRVVYRAPLKCGSRIGVEVRPRLQLNPEPYSRSKRNRLPDTRRTVK